MSWWTTPTLGICYIIQMLICGIISLDAFFVCEVYQDVVHDVNFVC